MEAMTYEKTFWICGSGHIGHRDQLSRSPVTVLRYDRNLEPDYLEFVREDVFCSVVPCPNWKIIYWLTQEQDAMLRLGGLQGSLIDTFPDVVPRPLQLLEFMDKHGAPVAAGQQDPLFSAWGRGSR